VKISILDETILKIRDIFQVDIPDTGTIIDGLAAVDQQLKSLMKGEPPEKLLQLIWNPETGDFYVDVGIEARDINSEWIPLMSEPLRLLHEGSTVLINPKAGL